MFKKLLLKALASFTPEEKVMFRKLLEDGGEKDEETEEVEESEETEEVDESKSETGKEDLEKGEQEEMETENKKETKTETEEDGKEKVTENIDETKGEEKPVEEPKTEMSEQPQADQAPQVMETEQQGNGIRVEDLVTKDELMERLGAMEAKFQAVLKENEDLKEKYENKNFGNFQKQGMLEKDKQANSSFEEYAKQFI